MQVTRVAVETAARTPTGTTNAYVVGRDPTVLVDPGSESAALDSALDGRTVAHVLVTHAHPDHVGGLDRYADGATVWGRRGYERRFADVAGRRPDRTVREGTTVPAGDGVLRVVDVPGHAPDHVAFVATDEATGRWDAVLCGDLARAGGSVAVAAPEGDLRAYLTSLRRLHARDPAVLYPGHGPRIDDPRATLARLVEHRMDRERRVLEAVDGGARDVESVLAAAYEKDLTGVRDLARATVRAHLAKLARERRVSWDPDRDAVGPADR
jgi:glyoxylase-like metal-dependent hydrolase (beta-lactamase superfamily II)